MPFEYVKTKTYFDTETGSISGTSRYNEKFKFWEPIQAVTATKEDVFDIWAKSDNIFASLTYKTANPFFVTAQSLFIKPLTGNPASNIDGTFVSVKEAQTAFFEVEANLIPFGKGAKGITYLEKLNCAQFSKLGKGTFVASMKPALRGKANKLLNYVIGQYNDLVPSGQIVADIIDKLKPDSKKKEDYNNKNF